jgi:hypothetical protein
MTSGFLQLESTIHIHKNGCKEKRTIQKTKQRGFAAILTQDYIK